MAAHVVRAGRAARLAPVWQLQPGCPARWPASTAAPAPAASGGEERVALAVTGTLQEGFSMRRNLDWADPATGAVTVGLYPIVTLQYSSNHLLYQESYQIQWLFP